MANLQLDNELLILEKYKLTPNELFLIKTLLIFEDDKQLIYRFLPLCKELGIDPRSLLVSLQSKGIITKAYTIPGKGEVLKPEEITFNQNFIKTFYKASFELGKELFDTYPQFCMIDGVMIAIRSVSKKFDSLEDFFRFYGKTISYNPELHNHIIESIIWAKENTTILNCTLANFVIDKRWELIDSLRNGDQGNITYNNIKVI